MAAPFTINMPGEAGVVVVCRRGEQLLAIGRVTLPPEHRARAVGARNRAAQAVGVLPRPMDLNIGQTQTRDSELIGPRDQPFVSVDVDIRLVAGRGVHEHKPSRQVKHVIPRYTVADHFDPAQIAIIAINARHRTRDRDRLVRTVIDKPLPAQRRDVAPPVV
jgi:hypothetical protein